MREEKMITEAIIKIMVMNTENSMIKIKEEVITIPYMQKNSRTTRILTQIQVKTNTTKIGSLRTISKNIRNLNTLRLRVNKYY